jgi:hypothetical protein
VLACLSKQPDARPKDALALRASLDSCAGAGSWTAADALAWWTAHDERIKRRKTAAHVSGTAATINIAQNRSSRFSRSTLTRAGI